MDYLIDNHALEAYQSGLIKIRFTPSDNRVLFFTDDGYGYEVFWTAERGEGSTEDGGINVLKDGAIIASLQCDTGSVRQDLAALIDMIDTAQLSP